MYARTLFLLFVIAVASSSSFAQVKWDIKAGLTYSNINAHDGDGNKASTQSVPGVYLGLAVGIPLATQVAVQPMFVYTTRGFKQPGSSHVGWGEDFTARVSYIELPVDFLYRPKVGPGNLLLAAGPYVAYGTGGSWKTKGPVTVGDIRFEGKGDIDFQNDAFTGGKGMNSYTYAKPWDYGVHLSIGYALFGQYAISAQLQRGIADLQPQFGDYKPKSTLRNHSFGATLSHMF